MDDPFMGGGGQNHKYAYALLDVPSVGSLYNNEQTYVSTFEVIVPKLTQVWRTCARGKC